MKQVELARLTGILPSSVSRWKVMPKYARTIVALSDELEDVTDQLELKTRAYDELCEVVQNANVLLGDE